MTSQRKAGMILLLGLCRPDQEKMTGKMELIGLHLLVVSDSCHGNEMTDNGTLIGIQLLMVSDSYHG